MNKTAKTELVKARVSKAMKSAVAGAAAGKGEGGEAEAIIVREALAEYFTRRGVDLSTLPVDPAPPAKVKYSIEKAAKAFTKTKKRQAKRKSAA